jgi:hypothetical protein
VFTDKGAPIDFGEEADFTIEDIKTTENIVFLSSV